MNARLLHRAMPDSRLKRPGTFPFRSLALAALLVFGVAGSASARSPETDARAGIAAFTRHCFSPRMSAARAHEVFNLANVRHDFYDLDPLTNAAPSPATKRAATPGTDRRCEVSFQGDYTIPAAKAVTARLQREGITSPAQLPASHTRLRTKGTALLAARRLNPRKIAVVHVGTRPAKGGIETFLNVERLRLPN